MGRACSAALSSVTSFSLLGCAAIDRTPQGRLCISLPLRANTCSGTICPTGFSTKASLIHSSLHGETNVAFLSAVQGQVFLRENEVI